MTYSVRLTSAATSVYKLANPALAKKLARGFQILEKTPRKHPNIKPLKGQLSGHYRYRAGNYRVVYRINDETSEVLVLAIAHRREVYE